MHSTGACSASPTRFSCSRRETSKSPQKSGPACSRGAASSTRRRRDAPLRAEHRRMGGLLVFADAISSIENFVHVFIAVYILLIFGYIITSWLRLPYSPWLNRVQRFLYDVCEPYLRLFRRVLPPLGPLDLSPIVAIFSLGILRVLID